MKEGSSGGASLCERFLYGDLSFHGGPGREPGGVSVPGLLRENKVDPGSFLGPEGH
jgi:hypothetical protein